MQVADEINIKAPIGIEKHSIDWIPDKERHGKLWHQAPLWFLGNFQYFTIPIGFIGPPLVYPSGGPLWQGHWES